MGESLNRSRSIIYVYRLIYFNKIESVWFDVFKI